MSCTEYPMMSAVVSYVIRDVGCMDEELQPILVDMNGVGK